MLVTISCDRAQALIYISGLGSPKTRSALTQAIPAKARAQVTEDGILLVELDLHTAPEGHRYMLCTGEVAYWPPASALLIALYDGCREVPSPLNYLGFVVEGLDTLKTLEGVFDVELRPSDREYVKRPFVNSKY